VLYFARGDVQKARSLLELAAQEVGQAGAYQKRKAEEQLKHNMKSMNAVAGYAENLSTCRRVLLMEHFGEKFDPLKCAGMANLSCTMLLRESLSGC
jgi:superfamily II DNA helicase RecQ